MSLQEGVDLNIVRTQYEDDYRITVEFSDGHQTTVDFEPFLSNSLNAETQQFLDIVRFKAFRLEWGSVVWGDYDMCFPIEDLYTGELVSRPRLAVAEERATYGRNEG